MLASCNQMARNAATGLRTRKVVDHDFAEKCALTWAFATPCAGFVHAWVVFSLFLPVPVRGLLGIGLNWKPRLWAPRQQRSPPPWGVTVGLLWGWRWRAVLRHAPVGAQTSLLQRSPACGRDQRRCMSQDIRRAPAAKMKNGTRYMIAFRLLPVISVWALLGTTTTSTGKKSRKITPTKSRTSRQPRPQFPPKPKLGAESKSAYAK